MNLETYIRNNRAKLDVDKPDEEYLWAGISQAMHGSQKRNHIILWRSIAAASVILLVSMAVIFYYSDRNKQQLIFVNIDPKLANQEAQFKNQIDNYSKLIKQASNSNETLATGSSEIQYLDDLIAHYFEDLKEKGPNPKLINSLMDLYRKKIMLLERMLNEIEKNQNYEKHIINI
ncbi:MAG TPA: hypothetical protein DIW31_01710 [Bacteroidales bacterium]|nr:hypothetical protein [Bacteroidales bacterium]